MDHFVEGNFDADPDWVVARACEMHDHIIETFQGHVVTEDAIKESKMATGRGRGLGPRSRTRPPSWWGGGSVARGTLGWYGDASGGFFLKSLDEWNPRLAFLVFPRITSSSRIDCCDIGRFELETQPIATLAIARQVRELQTALSVNKSELARILGVSRPTVYDWLDGGEPSSDNVSRIRMLLRVLSESRVSANNAAVSSLCEVWG